MKHFLAIWLSIFTAAAAIAASPLRQPADEPLRQPTDDPRWEIYTSFDTSPRRVIDTERYTYLLVAQDYQYAAETHGYNAPTGGLLFLDKQNPEAGFRDLRSAVTLHGAAMVHANYNPYSRVLVICYADGGVDLLPDGAPATYLPALRRYPLADSHTVNTVTFPVGSSEAWIATRGGFLILDTLSGEVLHSAEWHRDVNSICRIGTQVAAVVDGALLSAPLEKGIYLDFEAYTPILPAVSNAALIMPVADDAFAFLGGGSNDKVCLARHAEGEWTASTVKSAAGLANQWGPTALATIYDNKGMPTRDGYLLYSTSGVMEVLRGLAEDGTLRIQSRDWKYGNAPVFGSWDFEHFYRYGSRRRMTSCTATGLGAEASWTDAAEEFPTPDAPAPCRQTQFAWSPKYGMLVMNEGPDPNFRPNDGFTPLQLSGYRDGHWSQYSPNMYTPEACAGNEALLKAYNGRRESYPTKGPLGFFLDPLNPDWALTGSTFHGLTALNLADPSLPTVRYLSAKDNTLAALPGHHPIFPDGSWDTLCTLWPGGFDADGNFWFLYNNMFSTPPVMPQLWCWKADDRAATLASGDVDAGPGPKLMVEDITNATSNVIDLCLALSHPDNRGLVLIYVAPGADQKIRIVDTKGNDDPSDDEVRAVTHFRNINGGREGIRYIYQWLEDPLTGDIYVGGYTGVVTFNPRDEVVNGAIPVRPVGLEDPSGRVADIGKMSYATAIVFDEYHRLWIGTHTGGVMGLSADRRKVVAEYHTGNSPLPDNCITGLGWDSDRHRLMIGTASGICSVAPDDPAPTVEGLFSSETYADPQHVTPGYAGNIVFHNVPAASLLEIRDAAGNWVCSLPVPEGGLSWWDLRDADGRPVAPGLYRLHDISRLFSPLPLTIR